jgi:hypothetical protein
MELRCKIFVRRMGRQKARFRISIKDQASGKILKVELIPAERMFRPGQYAVRINGRQATKVPEANLTEVFDRLRRWVAGQV